MRFRQYLLIALIFPALLIFGIISCSSQPAENLTLQTMTPMVEEELSSDTISLLISISELLDNLDYEGALILFDEIEQENAEIAEIRLLRASILISAGQSAEARIITGEILQNHPDHIQALLVMATIEESQNRAREQRALLERILRLEPNHVPALISMGSFLIRSNNTRQAGSYFDRALRVEPENGDALLGRAWVYRNNRDSRNAGILLDRAVELYPHWARAFHERGRLLKSLGIHVRALSDLDRAKNLQPDNFFIAYDRADALRLLERNEEALAEYERAISIDPLQFMAYAYSASLRDALGDHDGAFADYQLLTRYNPDYYFGFEGLGAHLMRRQEWLLARDAFVEAYNRAVRANHSSSNENTFALLATVNWLRGSRHQEALQFMDSGLRRMDRNSADHRLLRLFRDNAGDLDVSNRADRERNPAIKARMLFYLANFYDIRGNVNLANRLYLQVRELNQKNIDEWLINEWILEERGLIQR